LGWSLGSAKQFVDHPILGPYVSSAPLYLGRIPPVFSYDAFSPGVFFFLTPVDACHELTGVLAPVKRGFHYWVSVASRRSG